MTNEGAPLYGVPSVRDGALMHRRGETTREAEVRHNPDSAVGSNDVSGAASDRVRIHQLKTHDSLKRGAFIMGLIEGASTLVLVYRRFS